MTKSRKVPPNRRLIGSKWVFNNNIDGQFTAFLVERDTPKLLDLNSPRNTHQFNMMLHCTSYYFCGWFTCGIPKP